MSKKNKRKRFVVEGSGAFPVDMLRYDHAWPEHEFPDSPNVALTYADGDAYLKLRQVTLLSDSPNAPTDGRWRSHTWRVVSVEVVV